VPLMCAAGAGVGVVAPHLGAPGVPPVRLAGGSAPAMLLVVRPPVLKHLKQGPELKVGHNRLVGLQGVVTEAIVPGSSGRISVDGETWQARCYNETLGVEVGKTVDVLQIDGATALVDPVPEIES
jgi:membrane protein implicated in regulation of membrane protease activity